MKFCLYNTAIWHNCYHELPYFVYYKSGNCYKSYCKIKVPTLYLAMFNYRASVISHPNALVPERIQSTFTNYETLSNLGLELPEL